MPFYLEESQAQENGAGAGSRTSADGRSPARELAMYGQHGGNYSWESMVAQGS